MREHSLHCYTLYQTRSHVQDVVVVSALCSRVRFFHRAESGRAGKSHIYAAASCRVVVSPNGKISSHQRAATAGLAGWYYEHKHQREKKSPVCVSRACMLLVFAYNTVCLHVWPCTSEHSTARTRNEIESARRRSINNCASTRATHLLLVVDSVVLCPVLD